MTSLSFWGFNDTVEDYDFDPDHARDILKSLTYTTKGGRSVWLDPITSLIVTVGGFLAIIVVSNRQRRI